jgi:hypothetical protein
MAAVGRVSAEAVSRLRAAVGTRTARDPIISATSACLAQRTTA